MNEEMDYFVESISEQLSLIVMTAFMTLFAVCIVLAIAL